MTNAFTSALNRARDAFDRNLVKRGQSRDSRDSVETDDSPFGSSLVTPVDVDERVNILHSAPDVNSVAKFLESSVPGNMNRRLESSSSVSMMDYFGFKNYNLKSGFPVLLSRSRTFQSSETSAGTSPVEEVQTRMGYMVDDDARPSPNCSTPGSIEEESLVRKKSIYNFPNKPIVIKVQKSECSFSEGTSRSRLEPSSDLIHGPSIFETENSFVSRSPSEYCGGGGSAALGYDLDDIENPDPLWFLRSVVQLPMVFATLFFKVILFVPWCTSVGGTILLWPNQLELVAFQTGYVDSMRGIRRFAHWADVGGQLVMIFLAFVLSLLWFLPTPVGLSLVFALGARFVLVWQGTQVDYSVPLGDDDKQTFYLLAILGERGLMEGTRTVTKTEAGFFVVPT